MVNVSGLLLAVLLSLVLLVRFPCDASVVASTRTRNFLMQIFMHVRRQRRETQWDFTELNLGLCPPSLCRAYDEQTGEAKPRPQGTGGTVFYQGDIVLDNRMTPYIYKSERGRNRRRKRATMRPRRRLWKNGVVIYKFAKAISPEAKKALEKGMKHIQKRTCITFREKKDGDRDFVRFISEPGCWSQVGQVGGIQLVSLGRGCEAVGTAVHEITHALGVWHEQARPDRDKFVKILERNISPKFMPDFEVVSKRISSARGYPYDYRSLMHYSKYAFTRNGRPTIEVIGVGKKLGMRIGQRRGLSTIDMAQIREMYRCNLKFDEKDMTCPKGFKKFSLSCYKFFPNKRSQFGPAYSACKGMGSNLLMLKDKKEERLVTRYANRKYPNVTTWRIGARRVNNKMMWKLSAARYNNITYSNWAKDHPSTFTSAVLKKNGKGTFLWHGEWVGSASQKPSYEHAYICERPAKRKCVNGSHADGRDYRGKLDHTRGGYTCQRWTEKYPHNHPQFNASRSAARSPNRTDDDGLGDHNYCRNPASQRRGRPWCWTTKKKVKWDFCDVNVCGKSIREAKAMRGGSSTTTTTTMMVPDKRQVQSTTDRPRSGKSNFGGYSPGQDGRNGGRGNRAGPGRKSGNRRRRGRGKNRRRRGRRNRKSTTSSPPSSKSLPKNSL